MKIRLGLEMASGGDLGSILVRFLIDFRSFSGRFLALFKVFFGGFWLISARGRCVAELLGNTRENALIEVSTLQPRAGNRS